MAAMSKAHEYRRQAEELREAATATRHKITRKTLLKLAEEFDRMAAHPVQNHPRQMPRITDT
jgi:F0F1-type ATP synthase membrane subunit b/b'